jgi:hypothetical protein
MLSNSLKCPYRHLAVRIACAHQKRLLLLGARAAAAAARGVSPRRGSKLQEEEEEEEQEQELELQEQEQEQEEQEECRQLRVPTAIRAHARSIARQRVRIWPLPRQTVLS